MHFIYTHVTIFASLYAFTIHAFQYMHFTLCISPYAFHSQRFTSSISLSAFHYRHFPLCISLYPICYRNFTTCISLNEALQDCASMWVLTKIFIKICLFLSWAKPIFFIIYYFFESISHLKYMKNGIASFKQKCRYGKYLSFILVTILGAKQFAFPWIITFDEP